MKVVNCDNLFICMCICMLIAVGSCMAFILILEMQFMLIVDYMFNCKCRLWQKQVHHFFRLELRERSWSQIMQLKVCHGCLLGKIWTGSIDIISYTLLFNLSLLLIFASNLILWFFIWRWDKVYLSSWSIVLVILSLQLVLSSKVF